MWTSAGSPGMTLLMPSLDSTWFRFMLAALSGGILVFAFPPWNLEFAAWSWCLPLLAVLWIGKPRGWMRSAALGWIAGFAFFLPNLAWVRHSSRVIAGAVDHSWAGWGPELMGWGAAVAMAAYLAIYPALWAAFTACMARPNHEKLRSDSWITSSMESLRSCFLSAAAWTGSEWLRGIVFTGFGWNGLGVGLHQNLVLTQIADVVGVTGLAFLPMFVACIGFNTLLRVAWTYKGTARRTFRADFSIAMILILAVVLHGWQRMNEPMPGEATVPVRTVLVQQNIPQAVKWAGEHTVQIYHRYAELTELYAAHADLIVWPESALPLPIHSHPDHPAYFNELLAKGPFSLLTGADVIDPDAPPHTSALLMRGNFESMEMYHKMHLVPFGEFLPGRNTVPFVDTLLGGILPGDFAPGEKAEPLPLAEPKVGIIPLICFEDTDGRLARRFVRPGPQMIVNLTNDGWFLQSSEMEQHLANAKFRSIELRLPMCRAANTGISCFIDTLGRVTQRLIDPDTGSHFIEGCLPGIVQVPLNPPTTFYARHGDVVAITMLIVAAAAAFTAWFRRSRAKA